jgi:transposase
MPTRPVTRDQTFLFPPSLGDLVPDTHTVRFVAAFVDALKPADWQELGIDPDGNPLGASSYHPRLLLGVWLYGFMTRVRSTRGLERACREQVPLLWLTGCQQPDHNSLWRFYNAHRESMHSLFKRTVRTAVKLDLVDLAVQAVDGTKIKANASRYRTCKKTDLERLMDQVEDTIRELEAQNEADDQSQEVSLPASLAQAQRAVGGLQCASHGVFHQSRVRGWDADHGCGGNQCRA